MCLTLLHRHSRIAIGLSTCHPFPGMEHPHNGVGDRDEIHRKIGRNMLLFQKAELRLKWLAERRRIAGYSTEIADVAAKLRDQVAGETMGAVMRRMFDLSGRTARDQEAIGAAVQEKGDAHLEFGFETTAFDGEADRSLRKGLEALVEHRNDLVHHFIEKFDLSTMEGRHQAGAYLDEQHDLHAPLVEELRGECVRISSMAREFSEALSREDVMNEILHGDLRPTLEEVLRRVAETNARADGWTYLSVAGKVLSEEGPWVLERMRAAFGHHGLRQAVEALDDRWELRHEPTGNGDKTFVYRAKTSDE